MFSSLPAKAKAEVAGDSITVFLRLEFSVSR